MPSGTNVPSDVDGSYANGEVYPPCVYKANIDQGLSEVYAVEHRALKEQ